MWGKTAQSREVSDFRLEKSVPVAESKQKPYAVYFEACFSRTFRVKLNELHAVVSDGSDERNIMFLCHRVVNRNVVFVLDLLNTDPVFRA